MLPVAALQNSFSFLSHVTQSGFLLDDARLQEVEMSSTFWTLPHTVLQDVYKRIVITYIMFLILASDVHQGLLTIHNINTSRNGRILQGGMQYQNKVQSVIPGLCIL